MDSPHSNSTERQHKYKKENPVGLNNENRWQTLTLGPGYKHPVGILKTNLNFYMVVKYVDRID